LRQYNLEFRGLRGINSGLLSKSTFDRFGTRFLSWYEVSERRVLVVDPFQSPQIHHRFLREFRIIEKNVSIERNSQEMGATCSNERSKT
jgi:Leu/Phe-tRNA-protein transferase